MEPLGPSCSHLLSGDSKATSTGSHRVPGTGEMAGKMDTFPSAFRVLLSHQHTRPCTVHTCTHTHTRAHTHACTHTLTPVQLPDSREHTTVDRMFVPPFVSHPNVQWMVLEERPGEVTRVEGGPQEWDESLLQGARRAHLPFHPGRTQRKGDCEQGSGPWPDPALPWPRFRASQPPALLLPTLCGGGAGRSHGRCAPAGER